MKEEIIAPHAQLEQGKVIGDCVHISEIEAELSM